MRDSQPNAGSGDARKLAFRQYLIETYNRRVADRAASDGHFTTSIGGQRAGEFVCACGLAGCSSILLVTLDDYREVVKSPHRMAVASGHASEINLAVLSRDEYEIVEIAPLYRLDDPPTNARD